MPEQPAAPEGVQTFEAAYFRQYNPVTAADIVNRVPGFEIDDGETLRGFGATAGNVLVNGERPSSKVLISEQLKRIPADSVVKVELSRDGTHVFTDFLSLYKTPDGWKIIGKIFQRHP